MLTANVMEGSNYFRSIFSPIVSDYTLLRLHAVNLSTSAMAKTIIVTGASKGTATWLFLV